MNHTYIHLDIETVPSQDPKVLDAIVAENPKPEAPRAPKAPPKNWVDQIKINAFLADDKVAAEREFEEARTNWDGVIAGLLAKTALGPRAHIFSIGIQVDHKLSLLEEACGFTTESSNISVFTVADKSKGWAVPTDYAGWVEAERKLLNEFFGGLRIDAANRLVFVGHRVIGFDLKMLRQRAVALGVGIPWWLPINPAPYRNDTVYDTMTQWDPQSMTSLGELASILGIRGKDGFDGSMVWPAIQRGEIERVLQYQAEDVELVRSVFKRMTAIYRPVAVSNPAEQKDIQANHVSLGEHGDPGCVVI